MRGVIVARHGGQGIGHGESGADGQGARVGRGELSGGWGWVESRRIG